MGHFILGLLLPASCNHLHTCIEQLMEHHHQTRTTIDAWEILSVQISTTVDVTPYAYIDQDNVWHERSETPYPEEEERSQQIHTWTKDHIAQYGYEHWDILQQRIRQVPDPVTNWHRRWRSTLHGPPCLVAFIWCHF